MVWDCFLSAEGRRLKAFSKTTPFTFGEVRRLSAKFSRLDKDQSGKLDFDELCQLAEIRANPFGRRLCRLFSEEGSERLSFPQFVNLTGIFCERTSLEIKIVWAFALWDFDGDDLIGAEDVKKGLRLISSVPSKNGAKLSSAEQIKVLERVFAEVDPMDAGLSFTDFKNVVSRMPDFFANFRVTV